MTSFVQNHSTQFKDDLHKKLVKNKIFGLTKNEDKMDNNCPHLIWLQTINIAFDDLLMVNIVHVVKAKTEDISNSVHFPAF